MLTFLSTRILLLTGKVALALSHPSTPIFLLAASHPFIAIEIVGRQSAQDFPLLPPLRLQKLLTLFMIVIP